MNGGQPLACTLPNTWELCDVVGVKREGFSGYLVTSAQKETNGRRRAKTGRDGAPHASDRPPQGAEPTQCRALMAAWPIS